MKTKILSIFLGMLLAFSTMASAEILKSVGAIDKLNTSEDGKTVTVTLKTSEGGVIKVKLIDELTLAKIKDKRIVVGDEIRFKYDTEKDNTATLFRKTGGC